MRLHRQIQPRLSGDVKWGGHLLALAVLYTILFYREERLLWVRRGNVIRRGSGRGGREFRLAWADSILLVA